MYNMNASTLLLFGSFTESDARMMFGPEEKKESQVASVNPGPGLVFGSLDNPNELVGSSNEPKPLDSSVTVDNGNHETVEKTSSNGAAKASTPGLKSNGSSSDSLPKNRNKVAKSKSNAKAKSKKNAPVVLIPRGLTSMANLRFVNAILQTLLYCSPFVELVQGLRSRKISKDGYPTLASFVEFIGEFDVPEGADKMQLEAVGSFNLTMFGELLRKFTKMLPRLRREDPQEFLSFIMDQMHSELLKLNREEEKLNREESDSNGNSPSLVSESEDEGWETVARKNKSAVTTQEFVPSEPSELTSIFGGQLRSQVKAKGMKPSLNSQPFLLLHLDIWHDNVLSVEDALHSLCSTETLDDYRVSTTGKDGVVAATKSVKILSLPKILILHLMRFSYDGRESTKLQKPVSFPLEMVLSRDLLVPSVSESQGRKYQLVSTVSHHGNQPSKGHYTADVRYTNGQWLRFNNEVVTSLPRKVLHNQPYLLFYKQL